jgi:hypothetical protein
VLWSRDKWEGYSLGTYSSVGKAQMSGVR